MSTQSGISTLLKAEKDAHVIVEEARKYRTQRLKAAKADAASEIEAYKVKKEEELKQFQASHAGSNDLANKNADIAVQDELAKIEVAAKDKKSAVVKLLVDAVTKPTPELHINA